MVCPDARRCAMSRSVKNACNSGASALMTGHRNAARGVPRPVASASVSPTDTSYPDLGITGITPIPGLFRYLLPRTHDGPATWDDALSRLSPAGIIRCVSCADGTSSAALPAHGDGAAMFVRTGGSIG